MASTYFVDGTTVIQASWLNDVNSLVYGGAPTSGPFLIDNGTAAAPAYSFTSSSSTGAYSYASNAYAISTNGTGRVFVSATGNVGIGAAPSSYSLEITKSQNAASGIVITNGNGGASAGSYLALADGVGKSANIGANFAGNYFIMSGAGGIVSAYSQYDTHYFQTNAGVATLKIGSSGQIGLGSASSYGTAGQVLTSGGAGSTATWTSAGSGTVTTISIAASNGFTGSVATATTTPVVTLATSITGVLKGNGTAISAATAGTDYVTPAGVEALTNKTYNGNTWTAGSGVLTMSPGKTLTVSNTITLAGTDSTTMTFPVASASIGYLNVPQNSQSAAYTTVLADQGKHILHPSADTTARVYTIDSNANVAYPVGTAITFVNQNSAGTITISITADTMRLAGAGTTGSRTLAANGVATALKITTTEWIISGTGLT